MPLDFNNLPSLAALSVDEKRELSASLLREQVIEQRKKLRFWRGLTGQPAQIDTGYIGQHLVSIITGTPGGGFRGKGDDLADHSEVKAANLLDSLDARGAVAPRWNFPSNSRAEIDALLHLPAIYLLSIDTPPGVQYKTELLAPTRIDSEIPPDPTQIDIAEVRKDASPKIEDGPLAVRFRVWRLVPREHQIFRERYTEWAKRLGYQKLDNPARPAINFQLFPPRDQTEETFARHGNGRAGGFAKLQIPLEGIAGSRLTYHAEIDDERINILALDP